MRSQLDDYSRITIKRAIRKREKLWKAARRDHKLDEITLNVFIAISTVSFILKTKE